jgi:hypothetical protein
MAVTKKSGIYWRYSGSGECAGTIVSLLAFFGAGQFLSQRQRPYSKSERAAVGFWGVVALFSLLASWGRFGFVYQFLYKLPYFSTIRNPIKFMHPFHIAWIILAAYGMEVLYRRYLRGPEKAPPNCSRPPPVLVGQGDRLRPQMDHLHDDSGRRVGGGGALLYVDKGA